MSQHYSDPTRAASDTALPDVETFQSRYGDCPRCGQSLTIDDYAASAECECGGKLYPAGATGTGWFYWYCMPGCLPDSEPVGPFDSEALAVADAQVESDGRP